MYTIPTVITSSKCDTVDTLRQDIAQGIEKDHDLFQRGGVS